MGTKRRIEENIATLIEERIGTRVKPDKKEISKTLRRSNLTPEDLIKKSDKNQLRKAFGKLIEILEELETTCD